MGLIQISSLPHYLFFLFRPGSLIVELKVGVEDSQVQQMVTGVKKILKSSSKFDDNYLVVEDLQGMTHVVFLLQK